MATDPEYSNLFANAGEEQQKLMLFVDMLLIDGCTRGEVEEKIIEAFNDEVAVFFCYSYLASQMAELKKTGTDENVGNPEEIHEPDIPIDDAAPDETAGGAEPEDSESKVKKEYCKRLTDKIQRMPGWDNFRKRIQEIIAADTIIKARGKAGLDPIRPTLHTAIVGNPGTGKSTAAKLLCDLYRGLGLIDITEVPVTKTAELTSFSGETEAVNSLVRRARGSAVIFEDAHELYHTEAKNYDAEQKIIRALANALDNKEEFSDWTLILTGDADGIAALLSANPDLKRHFSEPILMEDFTTDQLNEIVDTYCVEHQLRLSGEAREKVRAMIRHKRDRRSPSRGNAHFVHWLFTENILPAMYRRLHEKEYYTDVDLQTVEAEDVPDLGSPEDGMEALDALIGLGKIKNRIKDYLHAVRLAERRTKAGLQTGMPRLHMAFLGNPGTGKTTVADIIGRIFASWGILSEGRVIRTEKSQMVGQYIGETEFKMNKLLAQARGNILFIDEAYQLVEGGEKDFGRIVMNSLLTELGKADPDMVVIIAGYTAPMKQLLESNEGIESRFPNVFTFEDYTPNELLEIGKLMIRRQGFALTAGAEDRMRRIIEDEASRPSPHFGNGRFVSNLLQNEILASLGKRTATLPSPTPEDLSTILPEDVVIDKARKDADFDDAAIDAALSRLDRLAGLDNVKKAVRNFVRSVRYLHAIGEPYVGKGLLSWRFVGNTGTGKSTVAEIMAAILKGMRLLSNSHVTQIKGERIFNVPDSDCEAVLREAVKKSCNGLIFIDADDPKFHAGHDSYGRSVEQVRLKIADIALELGGECALILAELSAPNMTVAEQLSDAGVYEFDHTLVFKDFSPEELFDILCRCLERFEITFSPAAERHMREYIHALHASAGANARTMKIMSRTIHQQVILREAGLTRPPKTHQVQLADIETFKWTTRRKKIGFRPEA